MIKPKVFISNIIPEKGINMLRKRFEVEVNKTAGILKKNVLINKLKNTDVLLSLLSDIVDEEVILSSEKLKVISNYAVGYNNIDLKAATKRGIYVTNTPRTLDETTADFTFALILSLARRLVESDKFMRAGKFKGWGALDFLGFDVFNSTMGVIGMGSIGKEVAKRGYYGFNMKILYYDRSVPPSALYMKVQKTSLDYLLKHSDFVTLNIPLTKETFHLIGERELNLMKPTAYLINTSRGPVIDERALYKYLLNKKIAGAALDVYEQEPSFTAGLEKLDNIIMTPHIASASLQTRELMSVKAAQNIIDYFDGRVPEGLVNREVLEGKHIIIF